MHRPSRSSRRVPAVVLAAAALAGGCGDDEGGIPPASTVEQAAPTSTAATSTSVASTSSSSTGTTNPNPEHQVILDRYLAFWEARFAANEEPVNPDSPAFAEYATGPQLANVRAETARNAAEGVAFRLPESTISRRTPRVVSVAGDTAQLQDCVVDDGIVYRITTGEVVNDSVSTRNVSAVMRLVDGEWRLEAATIIQQWEGVAGCAGA
jgi:hypothetical protein